MGSFRCSQILAPTSAGPGIADLPCVAVTPISFAYSGVIWVLGPTLEVATCQRAMNPVNKSKERRPARKATGARIGRYLQPSGGAPDGKARDVVLRFGWVELLAQ